MKLSFAKIWTFIKNSFKAVLKGEFLFRLNTQNYFIHIVYTFFLFALIIWMSLKIDNAMLRVEKNNREIEELEIVNSQKTFELVQVSKRSAVKDRLKKMKSTVTENEKPAYKIDK